MAESGYWTTEELAEHWGGIGLELTRKLAKGRRIRKQEGIGKDLWLLADILEYDDKQQPLDHTIPPSKAIVPQGEIEAIKKEYEAKLAEKDAEIIDLKGKHLTEIKEIADKNDATRRSLEKERKDWDAFKDNAEKALEAERTARLSDVVAREEVSAKKEAELISKQEVIDADAAQNKADSEDNAKLKQDYIAGLAEIERGKSRIEQVYADAQKEAKGALEGFKQHVSGKTIGKIELAARMLSEFKEGFVKMAELWYSCPACHKEDAKTPKRMAHFIIPTLKWLDRHTTMIIEGDRVIYPGDRFGICKDCDKKESVKLPVYLCDICPMRKFSLEALSNIIAGLDLAGINIRWTADGVYIPHIDGLKEQGNIPAKEWVKRVLADTHLSDKDIQEKQEKALGKLAPPKEKELPS